uniref:Uncharacterized protein n=1 Tax=Oryza meridionalis TaxID=40149 RepID=A0A0E0C8N9_9ORYZ
MRSRWCLCTLMVAQRSSSTLQHQQLVGQSADEQADGSQGGVTRGRSFLPSQHCLVWAR